MKDTKDISQAEQDVKNAKTAKVISLLAFVVLHILAFVIPAHAGAIWTHMISTKPYLLVVNIAPIVLLAFALPALRKDKDWVTQIPHAWYGLIALTVASVVVIGHHAYLVNYPN